MAEPRPSREWPPSGWAAHEREQRRRYAGLTLAEKLDWLEEAHRLALRLRRPEAGPPEAPAAGGA